MSIITGSFIISAQKSIGHKVIRGLLTKKNLKCSKSDINLQLDSFVFGDIYECLWIPNEIESQLLVNKDILLSIANIGLFQICFLFISLMIKQLFPWLCVYHWKIKIWWHEAKYIWNSSLERTLLLWLHNVYQHCIQICLHNALNRNAAPQWYSEFWRKIRQNKNSSP